MNDFTCITNLQFKSHMRHPKAALEQAENTDTPEKVLEEIATP